MSDSISYCATATKPVVKKWGSYVSLFCTTLSSHVMIFDGKSVLWQAIFMVEVQNDSRTCYLLGGLLEIVINL